MSLNSLTVKKVLLTAGLLLVLGQGLWQLPELQDYLYPVDNEKSMLRQVSKECSRIQEDLGTLKARVDYLKWFQTHNGPDQAVSAEWLRAFPFSEAVRSLAPRYFWQTNIRLAHKNRLRVERTLQYLQGLLDNMGPNPPTHSPQAGPAFQPKTASLSVSMKQIKSFQDQYKQYNAKLTKLSQELARLEHDGYTK
jgi:hypothetical protein